jgi:hypothetical protein
MDDDEVIIKKNDSVLVLRPGQRIRITTPTNKGKTCIYLSVGEDERISLEGGSSIIAEMGIA